jgi:alpha-D-ribose 1-methylphosphonate 5-triphosphate synthase subunit PhnH
LALSGPGIRGTATMRAAGLPKDIVEQLSANRAVFPLGVDLLLVAGNDVAALPRTTIVARA